MKRSLWQWPGMFFGGQWLKVACGVTLGLLFLQGQTKAQDNWPNDRSRPGDVLSFRANGNVAVSEFQIPLKKRVSEQDATTLNASDLGPITLRSSEGKPLRIERYRWKIDPSSRFYQGQSGYKSLIAIYQYGDTSQYSLRLNCRTRQTLVNCAMDGHGPLFDDEVVAKGNLSLTSGSSFAEERPDVSRPTDEPLAITTQLPRVNGINVRDVRVVPAEKQANSELERAILSTFADGKAADTRYFYNRIDLNSDNSPETIVYLVGRSACGSGGCTTLVFQSDRGSSYRLVSKMTLMNQPIIVSDNRSNRWKDLVTYVAGGGTSPGYRILRYDGRSYPSNPSTQPGLANPTYLSGTAVIGDRIQPETTAPILGRGSSSWDQPSANPSNYPPNPPEDDRPVASNGQSNAYRRGYELGQLDAQQSILRNAARHRTEYDSASESDFRRGYDNGYSNYASGNSSNGTNDNWNRNGGGSSSRTEADRGDWSNRGSNRDGDTAKDSSDRSAPGNGSQYQGQGTLIVAPASNQGKEERYILNRIRIESGSQDRLVLYTDQQTETIELLGRLDSSFNGRSLTLSSIDGVPAQGKVLIGSNGSLRTSNPIVVRSEDSEVSVDFRPN